MIEIEEALELILSNKTMLDKISVDLMDALGFVLAEDVHSPIHLPSFSQSAMDGYAICGEQNQFEIKGIIKAGDTSSYSLKNGECYRIFTGAKVPENTTSIAKQEIVKVVDHQIILQETVKSGTSIRLKGEELAKDEVAILKGTKINSAAIGLLAGLGKESVKIYRKPKISIIVTGDELIKLGNDLPSGKIYESNSFTLRSALKSNGFEAEIQHVEDDFERTKSTIDSAIQNNDVVILSGGISVGDYDFVGKAVEELQVEKVFYKINQKPGKPMYHGLKDGAKIFALPGNPAAALTCYYFYVLPAIQLMAGETNNGLQKVSARLSASFLKKGDRAFLLKAQISKGTVTIHKGQSSAMLSSFVNANCLLYLKKGSREYQKNDEVEVFLIPQ